MINDVSPTLVYVVENKNKHGAANKNYNLIFIEDSTGDIVPLLFSDSDISDGFVRGAKNKEDIPKYRLRSKKECVNTYIAGMLCVGGFISGIAAYWVAMQTFN